MFLESAKVEPPPERSRLCEAQDPIRHKRFRGATTTHGGGPDRTEREPSPRSALAHIAGSALQRVPDIAPNGGVICALADSAACADRSRRTTIGNKPNPTTNSET
jgi:hypothetical protein